jgi:hypothetical protein
MIETSDSSFRSGISIRAVSPAVRSAPARWLGASLLAIALAGCQMAMPDIPNPFSGGTSTSVSAKDADRRPKDAASQDGKTETPRFTQFTDIPIPANAKVDLDNLLVLGTEDGWIGRLALGTGELCPKVGDGVIRRRFGLA